MFTASSRRRPIDFALRDYGTGRWEGGDEACDHKRTVQPWAERSNPGGSRIGQGGAYNDAQDAGQAVYKDTCGKCGARRVDDQIGLEATIDAYLARLVAVFEQVRRVLHPSGVLWVNQGDSYSSGHPGSRDPERWPKQSRNDYRPKSTPDYGDLPAKNLIGMPWRLAFALQAAGWFLRAECIWAKPNPMPESVTDRPTRAHEQVFLFSKQARYYYDAEAVKEIADGDTHSKGPAYHPTPKETQPGTGVKSNSSFQAATWERVSHRNLRTIWSIPSEPFSVRALGNGYTPEWTGQDHYAAFPTRLAERCILAGSSQRGVCPACEAPWRRVVERGELVDRGGRPGKGGHLTLGWAATCSCGLPEDACVPATVLDPFVGTGATILTALRHGRSAIGIDLSQSYCDLARARIIGDAPFNALWEVRND